MVDLVSVAADFLGSLDPDLSSLLGRFLPCDFGSGILVVSNCVSF